MIINEYNPLHFYTLQNPLSEYGWIARNVDNLIKERQVQPSDIAIIAPKRAILREISHILNTYSIPSYFDEGHNLLEKPHTKVLFTFLKYLNSVHEQNPQNELLSDILCYPFWGLKRETVWNIFSQRKRTESIISTLIEDTETQHIGYFIQTLTIKAQSESLESLLDSIVGNQAITLEIGNGSVEFNSPYKQYYFSDTVPENEYLEALSSIRTIYEKIRSFHAPTLKELINYLDSLEQFNLPLNDGFSAILEGVQLLTVHGSKGLEFKYVFLPSCSDEVWYAKPRGSVLSWPRNLSTSPLNYEDDVLRLFYVACTRAKDSLIISYPHFNSKDKEQQPFRALSDSTFEHITQETEIDDNNANHPLMQWKETWNNTLFEDEERQALKQRVKHFKMTVTALNKFLAVDNAFGGGPEAFYKETLLRFPQRRNSSAGYGNAIHKAIAEYCLSIKRHSQFTLEELFEYFDEALHEERLDTQDEEKLQTQGKEHLKHYIQHTSFSPQSYIELSIETQLKHVPVKGIIDRADLDGNFWKVIDLKTGKAFKDWDNSSKSLDYQLQLQFYKLLIEHSPQYQGIVSEGVIDFVQDEVVSHNQERNHITLPLNLRSSDQDRLEKLITAVYAKIVDLDFPDTSHYPQNHKGRVQFEEDLIEGRV